MLDRHTLYDNAEFEVTRDFHLRHGLRLEPVDLTAARGTAPSSAANFANRDLMLYRFQYGLEVDLQAPRENPNYFLAFPVRTDAKGRHAPMKLGGDLASPDTDNAIRLQKDQPMISVSVLQSTFNRFVEPYFGEHDLSPVRFDQGINMGHPAVQSLGWLLTLLLEDEKQHPQVLDDARRMTNFVETVISTLVFYCSHSHSHLLARRVAAPASRDVRRVIDYIRAHPDQPISLADLVEVAGVPGRTLNQHFRAFTGLSPMGYLKRARLRRAREILEQGQVASVTEAAFAAGITHLGRFSREYAKAFVELPSETLARCRRH